MMNINFSNKKQNTILFPITVLSALILMCSCQEDFLELKPRDSFTEEVVFNDPVLSESFVYRAYSLITYGFESAGWALPLSWMCDENNARLSDAATGPITLGEINPSYLGALDVWTYDDANSQVRSYWPAIKQCNEFLEKTKEGSTLDENLLRRLRGETKVIRAYSYFRLISYFGGVPLITQPFSLEDEWKVSRESYDVCMNFIINELNESIDVLPLQLPSNEYGRLTKGAAMAIKARALLYYASPLNNPENDLERWQEAAEATKAIIDLGLYGLHSDYKELFTEAGGYNTTEIIWGRQLNNNVLREVRTEQLFFPNGWRGYGQIHPYQNLVDDFEMINGKKIDEVDSGYDQQNPYINRDPRFYYTILYDGAPFKERTVETFYPGGQDSPEGTVSSWNATQTGYYPRKFIDESKTGFGWGPTANSDPTWMWFRYGEILLNYAEIMFMLGNEEICREYLNIIRSRPSVNMPLVTDSGEDLWNRVINERRIELVFEEHRFFDVRRWKIAEDVLSEDRTRMYVWKDSSTGNKTYEVRFFRNANFNSWNYFNPIPQSEIDKNGLLEQNPGYN